MNPSTQTIFPSSSQDDLAVGTQLGHHVEDPEYLDDPREPPQMVKNEKSTASTSARESHFLRDYASHIDPLQLGSEQGDQKTKCVLEDLKEPEKSSRPSDEVPTLPRTKSFRSHRKNICSVDSIPRQTIMKALASRPPPSSNMSIAQAINGMLSNPDDPGRSMAPRRLSAALSELQLQSPSSSPTSSKLAALASPCFFHKRFDDAVNIDKVLEEIKDDEWLSHSRLMQTATGVREVSKQLQRRPIKRAVRNVMIVTKARDNHLVTLTRELAEWLLRTPRYGNDVGVNVYVDAKLKRSKRFDSEGLLAINPSRFSQMLRYWTPEMCWTSPEKFDLVLTLGGDGTVLFTSWLFQRIVPPILSFSLGSLGFLTSFHFEQYKDHLNRVMGDSGMRVSVRMRFTCTVYRRAGPNTTETVEGEQFEVINELVIDRGPSSYISNLELYGDDNLLTVVQADGCIFSTPTGSTAYSLSAGGSLVHPDIPAILLTPICPHTLSFRPMLLNDTMALKIAVPRHSRATAYCSFDGKGRVELRQGDHVTIAASQYPFPTVLSTETEWFDSIGRTLRWNSRGAQQKGWGQTGSSSVDSQEMVASETDSRIVAQEQDEGFDIDIDENDQADSGFEGSMASGEGRGAPGTASPARKLSLLM